MTDTKRKSRRYAIAFCIGANYTDVERYQPTVRTSNGVPVYSTGDGYLVALRDGEAPPKDFGEFKLLEADVYGYRVLHSPDK